MPHNKSKDDDIQPANNFYFICKLYQLKECVGEQTDAAVYSQTLLFIHALPFCLFVQFA